jgi:DNA helicase-2/ATP-dependent DNA helicase PcrA
MSFVADLHIHSKYSRATSRECDVNGLAWWGARKGITVIGTGDFTHPAYFEELSDALVPAEPGLYRLAPDAEGALLDTLPASCRKPVRFMLSVEISTIYKRDDKTRKVHHLIYMPDLEAAGRFNKRLGSIGNIRSDGRPILGLDSRHLLEVALEASPDSFLVPAHIWTPWFAVLGSQSGFDLVDDCYADLAHHVFAVETGLSSDPSMNRRVSSLDRFQLVSNSDAHSPGALAREATVFDTDISYFALRDAMRTGDGLVETLEFFPEEGKYHLDGHRKCGVRWEPRVTQAHDDICEVCDKPVTVGVAHRVEELADRDEHDPLVTQTPFTSFIQLSELIGEVHGVGAKSKRVAQDVARLVERFGPELDILRTLPIDELATAASPLVAEAISRVREGRVIREGGFDGEYGTIRVFEPGEIERRRVTSVLFEIPTVGSEAPRVRKAGGLPGIADVVDIRGTQALHPSIDGPDAGQLVAGDALDGPVLITAGPGSGKTRTLVERFNRIVDRGVDPTTCLAITFTRRARDELRERLQHPVVVKTFHGFGFDIVREHHEVFGLPADFRILGEQERLELLDNDRSRAKTVSKQKRERGDIDESYEAAVRARGAVDLDDLLVLPVQLFSEHPDLGATVRERWQYVAVDEYQDVERVQYELLQLITSPSSNICVVGDPDQAIYGFRGSSVEHFLTFRDQFDAQQVTLERNYRSAPPIVRTALQLIAPGSLVPERALVAMQPASSGSPTVAFHHTPDGQSEAAFVASTIESLMGGTTLHAFDSGRAATSPSGFNFGFSDFAVLARTDKQMQPLLDAFHHAGIPAQKRAHTPLAQHAGVAALVAALRDIGDHSADTTLQLVSEVLPSLDDVDRFEVLELVTKLAEQHPHNINDFLNEIALGAEIDTWDARADRVSLLTLHASKGLEFPVVFVVGVDDGMLPLRFGSAPISAEHTAEERRLLFVGMTRARSHLHLSTRTQHPSPFLESIEKNMLSVTRAKPRPNSRQLKLL